MHNIIQHKLTSQELCSSPQNAIKSATNECLYCGMHIKNKVLAITNIHSKYLKSEKCARQHPKRTMSKNFSFITLVQLINLIHARHTQYFNHSISWVINIVRPALPWNSIWPFFPPTQRRRYHATGLA